MTKELNKFDKVTNYTIFIVLIITIFVIT
ncbi:unnamed protein product [Oppiella nova]|uniref:Uncharacterized protein n=1 Tax=Oppiella nova TaxID=334625 RepID=A0A7R9MMC5_9ACAR|nr:unnamed protein product [Oppiella nova]CAG2179652.1 unnamed protein product [Oppiella nova]